MSIILTLNTDLSETVKYTNKKYPIYMKRALLSSYPDFRAPSHWHNDIELIYIISGEMNYNVNGKVITISSGEGIFVNTRQLHFGFSDTQNECDFICILLSPVLICLNTEFEKEFILPVIQNNRLPYIHFAPISKWQNEALNIIRQIYDCNGIHTEALKVQSLFSNLWSLIFENMECTDTYMENSSSIMALKNMVGYVQKNYTEKITLKQIAMSGRVCVSKCCQIFKEYLGQTPNTFLINYRLDKSVELLNNTDLSISEIASDVGFGGASYFSETFHKWFGKSPTEYINSQKLHI